MKVTIEQYNATHRQSCIEAFRSNVPLFFTVGEVSDFEEFLDSMEGRIGAAPNNAVYFVALHGEEVIGCGGFGHRDGEQVISLAWGLVHNDHHKRGIGKQLLVYRIEKIKEMHPGLPLVLDTTQHSFHFFEQLGFRTTKVTDDFYAVGMHRYDMVLSDSDIAYILNPMP